MRLLIAALGITALLALTTPSPRYTEGKATYYSQGTMQRVAAYRNIDLGGASGYATYPDCAKIGGLIYVSVLNPRTQRWSSWDKMRIVDCSMPAHRARHEAIGLVEFSWEDALRYGFRTEGRSRVRFYLGASR